MRKKVGLPPGSIVFTGNQKVEQVHIHYMKFNANNIEEQLWSNHDEFQTTGSDEDLVEWFDVRGLHDTALVETIGSAFDIHPLALEDMVDVRQRPKLEEYETGIFILLKALYLDKATGNIESEQVSLYLKKNIILSFQEKSDDLFLNIRHRLHAAKGKIRKRGTDYFAYALMDSLVDNYYLVLDHIEAQMDILELEIQDDVRTASKQNIYQLKQQLLFLRKAILPLREVVNKFLRLDDLEDSTIIFLKDLYDHIIQIGDILESHRDILNSLHDLYLTEISFRQNKVIQLLTIITTIFVPLTFLAGIYGMNFDNIPELHWQFGYFGLLLLMGIIAVGCIAYFRYKEWM